MIPRRVLLGLALACAAVAGLAYYVESRRVPVVTAARAIAGESTLRLDDLATTQLPVDAVPRDALIDRSAAVGRVVHAPLLRGQLVLTALFEGPPGFRSGIAPPAGWRAVAVPVTPATALGGAVAPGMRVDVFAVPLQGRAPADRATERIARAALVLDVRSDAGAALSEPTEKQGVGTGARVGSVVIAVPPQDDLRIAERIATSTFVLFRAP